MKKTSLKFLSFFTLVLLVFAGQAVEKSTVEPMLTVKIGEQAWCTKNLDVFTFQNGDSIFHAKSDEEWIKAGEEGRAAWCYYKDDTAKGKIYGKLYNWFAVGDPRGLAPKGWHIATHEEWKTLVQVLGGDSGAGGKLRTDAKAPANEFNCLNAGLRDYDATYSSQGNSACFWTGTAYDETRGWDRQIMSNSPMITTTMDLKAVGFSVRCIKDKR